VRERAAAHIILALLVAVLALAFIVAVATSDVFSKCDLGPADPAGDSLLAGSQAPGEHEERLRLADGGELHYREAGQGAPILLIHGTGAGLSTWSVSFARLAEHHHVIAYDRRGFGSSTSAVERDYYHQQQEDAASLLRYLHLDSVTVVGASAGGNVALELAVRHPELVGQLVLVEPGYHFSAHPPPDGLLMVLRVAVIRQLQGEQCARLEFSRWTMARQDGSNGWDRLPVQVRRDLLRNSRGFFTEAAADSGWDDWKLTDEEVKGINVPVVLLVGEQSPAFAQETARGVAKLLPQAHVQVVPDAGHALVIEQPATFESAVLKLAG
jgi:pimeloyl-ACP methyl ester carboxylesterase